MSTASERIVANVTRNGSAGCSAQWLADKVGLSRGSLQVIIWRINAQRKATGDRIIAHTGFSYVMADHQDDLTNEAA